MISLQPMDCKRFIESRADGRHNHFHSQDYPFPLVSN